MRIQLLHPPVYRNSRALTALRPSPPLGLAYIAAALREAGHAVSVLDAAAAAPDQTSDEGGLRRVGLVDDEIVRRIDPRADAVGITAMFSFAWPEVRRLIQRLRREFPHLRLVGGGEHFSGLPQYSLREAPLDIVVIGEGEQTAVELFDGLERGSDLREIPGIAFLDGDDFVRTASRARHRHIDELPPPAWDLFDLAAYNDHAMVPGLRSGFTVPILATRGCPYRCTYCSSPSMWTTAWVARDPVLVVDEIEGYQRDYGADNFPFQDLTAILKKSWIVAFATELLRRDLRITWQLPSGTRCEVIDDEVASLLARSGGHHLAFAPETGSQEARERIKKQLTEKSLMNAVDAAARADLSLSCFVVLGFPGDTRADLRATTRMVRRLARHGVTDIGVGYFFPIPNTELFHELEAAGTVRLNDDFLRTPMHANDLFVAKDRVYCRELSARQLSSARLWMVANFYAVSFALRPWRLARVLRNAWRGVETGKLESFLIEARRRPRRPLLGLQRIGTAFSRGRR